MILASHLRDSLARRGITLVVKKRRLHIVGRRSTADAALVQKHLHELRDLMIHRINGRLSFTRPVSELEALGLLQTNGAWTHPEGDAAMAAILLGEVSEETARADALARDIRARKIR